MYEMKNVKSDGSVGDETEKGGTIHRPFFDDKYTSRFVRSKSKTCHFRARVQLEYICSDQVTLFFISTCSIYSFKNFKLIFYGFYTKQHGWYN